MTKLQLLHRALNERMMAAVEQIMEMVGGTVLEYEEETTRVRKENEVLRRRLQWMEESSRADWPGTWDPVTLSTPDESNPTQHEESVVSFDFGQESQAVVIKTESTDNPLFVRPQSSLATMTQGTEQGSAVDETSAHFDQGNRAGSWDSTQSYMAPLEFDPSSSSRLRCYEVKGKRQRMSFACPDCGKVFGRKQGLIFHMRVHSTERPYVYRSRKECIYTDIRRYKRRGLPKRSRENTEDLSDSSEQANRSSPSAEHPEKSDQTSRDKGPENITSKPVPFPRKRKQKNKIACCRCPLCGQGFSQKDQLTLHLKSHVQKARQSPVTYPNKARSGDGERQKNKMRKHIGAVKKATVVFPCPECDRVFARPSWLDNHIKSHVCETALLHKQLEVNVPDQTELPKEETKMGVPEDGGSTEVPSRKLKKAIPCPYCDKVFSAEGWLRSHVRGVHCKRKTNYFDVETGVGRTRSQKTLANQHLRKTKKTKRHGFGTHSCKLCYKSYSSKSWLCRHMRLHLKEGLAAPGRLSKTNEMQDNEENTDEQSSRENTSDESAGEESMDRSAHLRSSAADTASKGLTSSIGTVRTSQPQFALQAGGSSPSLLVPVIEQPVSAATCDKSNQNSKSKSVTLSHLSLQPRVVLEPFKTKCMYWSTVPSVDDSFEKSNFNMVQTSSTALGDGKIVIEDNIVDQCTKPVESLDHDNQNKHDTTYSVIPEAEIVCVTVGVPQNDSQSETVNQVPLVVIDDEEQSVTQISTAASLQVINSGQITAAENDATESRGTKPDCEEISAMKLTVIKQAAVSESAFKETSYGVTKKIINPKCVDLNFSDDENDMDDLLSPSKGFEKKKTPILAENHSSVWFPNDSQSEFWDQVPLIVIDDEQEQSVTQTSSTASLKWTSLGLNVTAAENALTETGGIQRPCKTISAMKVRVTKKTAVSESVFKETIGVTKKIGNPKLLDLEFSDVEDDMDDALRPSNSDSHIPAPHATEAMEADQPTCSEVDFLDERKDQSISNNTL